MQEPLRTAVIRAHQGVISKEQAVRSINPARIEALLHPQIGERAEPITTGTPVSPGAVSGRIAFDSYAVAAFAEKGEPAILVKEETSAQDVAGIKTAQGVMTVRGGRTSHAAVVTRGIGKPSITGSLETIIEGRAIRMGASRMREGDVITIDGSTGAVYEGALRIRGGEMTDDMMTLLEWADDIASLQVYANADTKEDIEAAIMRGAKGIGVVRSEHMFMDSERITAMREMILSQDPQERERALDKIFPYQRSDFIGLFEAAKGMPITIRLLDPPLHEFLPSEHNEQQQLAAYAGMSLSELRKRIEGLREQNPMLGTRGCRLGITVPQITQMQSRAILEAALHVQRRGGYAHPEIMIPLVSHVNEYTHQKGLIDNVTRSVFDKEGASVDYRVGTMIEVPRAALEAAEIAKRADFFSFGTNDLTQTTLGLSRDDVKFIPDYVAQGIYPHDPFQTIDEQGVGKLIRTAVEEGRKSNPDLKIGVCGEHGGDPQSIRYFHDAGVDYVSCSPPRIPVARMAAAHAALERSPHS